MADQDKFYPCAFGKEDHDDLRALLVERGGEVKFFLTYDAHWDVQAMYGIGTDFKVWAVEWGYAIQRTDDQRNGRKLADGHQGRRTKGKELLITTYELGDDNG